MFSDSSIKHQVFLKKFRWHNHLNPNIKKDAWTMEEELTLLNAHRIHGNKWAELAKLLPGRYNSFMLTQFLLDKEIKEFYIFIWWTTQKEACPWILD